MAEAIDYSKYGYKEPNKNASDKIDYSQYGYNDKSENIPSKEERIKKLMNLTSQGEDFASGLAQGLSNLAPGIANLGIHAFNGATGNNTTPFKSFDFAPNNVFSKSGEIASYGVGLNPSSLIAKIPLISNALQKAGAIAPRLTNFARNVASGATQGAVYSPENQTEGAIFGGAVGGTLPVIGKAISKVYNSLRPSNLFRGNLTPEQLQNNLEMTKGTETGLGDVINSPFLKRIQENVLSKIPFSGANESMMRSAGSVIDKGHEILNKLLGSNNPENLEQSLSDTLQDVYKSHQDIKSNLYKKVDSIANKVNLNLELPKFAQTAQKFSSALENTNILKYEPEVASLIKKVSRYKQPVSELESPIVNEQGIPFTTEKYPTLKEANLLKGKLNTLANSYSSSPDPNNRAAGAVFSNLARSLKSDIQTAIKASGHEELKHYYNLAEENYKKNFSPFLDKEIYKFAHGDGDPDLLLQTFIKTGKSTDRANVLNKLVSKLPEDKKNLLGHAYLQRALDENNVLNPLKLKTLISKNSLGKRQFETLFPDSEVRNSLRNYSDLVKKNTKGLEIMENPKTGQMNTDILGLMSKTPTGLIGKMLLAKPLVRKMTSEKTRENLVKKMIEKSNQGNEKK